MHSAVPMFAFMLLQTHLISSLPCSNSFMLENCSNSCHKHTVKPPEIRHISDDQQELYSLSAKDANGKLLSMESFEGYVTVIVNAARVCGEKSSVTFANHNRSQPLSRSRICC